MIEHDIEYAAIEYDIEYAAIPSGQSSFRRMDLASFLEVEIIRRD
jgi:hypothetical protein